jgi:hypothetical protein
MTLTIFDPLTGKRVTITVPEEPAPQTPPRARALRVSGASPSRWAGRRTAAPAVARQPL